MRVDDNGAVYSSGIVGRAGAVGAHLDRLMSTLLEKHLRDELVVSLNSTPVSTVTGMLLSYDDQFIQLQSADHKSDLLVPIISILQIAPAPLK